jgi:hypothetical protein
MAERANVSELANELHSLVEYQQTPRVITDGEYEAMILHGIKRLLIDTGRAAEYSASKLIYDDGMLYYDQEFTIDEIEYILLVSQIRFFGIVRASVNEMVSYTTNALSVTQGDKPYANITGTLRELENERRIVYYKMVPYTISMEV